MPLRFCYLILFACFIMLSSCGPDYLFQKKYDFGSSGWAYTDTLTFQVPVKDTMGIYNLFLDVNHTDDYAYQNLYIRIHTTFPDQQKLTERLSVDLAAKNGVWNGACSGKNCQLRVNIQQGAFFNQSGDHTFMIEQFMRQDTLNGVTGITFSIEDTGKSRAEKVSE